MGEPSVSSETGGRAIYRLARKPNCWTPPDWLHVGTGRFDDSVQQYRVLYVSSVKLGCFLEALARFRVDLKLIADLDQITGANDFHPLGVVPLDWLMTRLLGAASFSGIYVDVLSTSSIAWLRLRLASYCARKGIRDFDAASLLQTEHRALTQQASRIVYEAGYNGICYVSKFGYNVQNWVLFEPFLLSVLSMEDVRLSDPDLLTACKVHGLAIESVPMARTQ